MQTNFMTRHTGRPNSSHLRELVTLGILLQTSIILCMVDWLRIWLGNPAEVGALYPNRYSKGNRNPTNPTTRYRCG